jgi:hypothetical protein
VVLVPASSRAAAAARVANFLWTGVCGRPYEPVVSRFHRCGSASLEEVYEVGGTLDWVHLRLLFLAGVILAVGCGSSSKSPQATPGTLEALTPGPERTVALTPGDADFAPGPVRYSFLLIAKDGRVVAKPRAAVWLARGLKEKPFQRATATLESVGVPGAGDAPRDVPSIYVVHLNVPAKGTYWVLAKPEGSPIAGLGNIVVQERTASLPVGADAPPSRTPTLATTGGRLGPLTTATHPDRALYETSVAGAVAAHRPFVVAFATPKFCVSRTCGPIVDVVSHVRKQVGPRVTFIHAEVFQGNNPANGYNPWMTEWKLPSEPWIFLVGRDGRIKAKFEGSVSVGELRAAVRSSLED